jgi:hypothetical protein
MISPPSFFWHTANRRKLWLLITFIYCISLYHIMVYHYFTTEKTSSRSWFRSIRWSFDDGNPCRSKCSEKSVETKVCTCTTTSSQSTFSGTTTGKTKYHVQQHVKVQTQPQRYYQPLPVEIFNFKMSLATGQRVPLNPPSRKI